VQAVERPTVSRLTSFLWIYGVVEVDFLWLLFGDVIVEWSVCFVGWSSVCEEVLWVSFGVVPTAEKTKSKCL